MALTCASRFAVLRLEDDEDLDKMPSKTSKLSQNLTSSTKNKVNSSKNGVTETKSKPKKKKKQNDAAELQNLAFGTGTQKSKNKNGPQSLGAPRNANVKQWEEWKKKDQEFVTDVYEQDLQQAILLSKIDYEERKDVYDATQKESENNKSNASSHHKKKKNNPKKDKGTMSLDKFQSLSASQIESGNYTNNEISALDDFSIPAKKIVTDEADFFDKIEEDAERMIEKEQRQETYKKLDSGPQNVCSLHFQDELEKKDDQIRLITEERDKLKEELKIVKTRNKRLCGILATGEMREKAELLIEMEQLTIVRDELTEQLNEHIGNLEQEKSKVHSLQAELKKFQSNRKEHRDSK